MGILFLLVKNKVLLKESMLFKAHSNKCEWKAVATALKSRHHFTLGCKSKRANFSKLAELPFSQLFFHDLLTGCQGWKRLLTLRVQLHGNGPLRCVRGIRPYSWLLWRKTSFGPQHASHRGRLSASWPTNIDTEGIFGAARHWNRLWLLWLSPYSVFLEGKYDLRWKYVKREGNQKATGPKPCEDRIKMWCWVLLGRQ